jgi:hypothetical protein
VVAGKREADAILHWSWWRRWHQAWAAWHHTRRRAAALPDPPALPDPAPTAAPPADIAVETPTGATLEAILAQVWARLEPLLPILRRSGRQQVHDRRHILEAIVYVMQTDCGWNAIPSRFPPWKTVHTQYVTWRTAGIWTTIWAGITPPGPRLLE